MDNKFQNYKRDSFQKKELEKISCLIQKIYLTGQVLILILLRIKANYISLNW
jgi:hypothetical protein